jgi:wyosine [tRNA(Phe)-imidazoG37] synthetase (radical SAM superfamily)
MKESSPFKNHSREFENYKYTYPVISRRSGGLSIGINLSLRKECNFDCPYCQVDRTNIIEKDKNFDLDVLNTEIIEIIEKSISGEIFNYSRFSGIKENYKNLQDISLSGDGEPTTSKYFTQISELVFKIILEYSKIGIQIKPVTITNASMLHKKEIREILFKMEDLGGGPWIKLDAGNEMEFKKVAETKIEFKKILENILSYAKEKPATLQTIIYIDSEQESFTIQDYIETLKFLRSRGGKFRFIQLYTLARDTRIKELRAVSEERLQNIANIISTQTEIPVGVYP